MLIKRQSYGEELTVILSNPRNFKSHTILLISVVAMPWRWYEPSTNNTYMTVATINEPDNLSLSSATCNDLYIVVVFLVFNAVGLNLQHLPVIRRFKLDKNPQRQLKGATSSVSLFCMLSYFPQILTQFSARYQIINPVLDS